MDIKLDSDKLQELMGTAILQSLDQIQRLTLIQGAITYLIAPQRSVGGGYGSDRPSPIQEAFQSALRDLARKMATDLLTEDSSVAGQVRKLMDEAVTKVMIDKRDDTVNRIAEAIAKGMTGEHY